MPQDQEADLPDEAGEGGGDPPARRRSPWKTGFLAVLGIVLLAVALGWLNREDVADTVIASELEALGLPATYKVREIAGGRQVIEDVVVGDPARPDLTVERIETGIELRWGMPRLASITLVRPRLYGRYRGGKLSFGSLDPLIFTGSKKPFELPELELVLRDGRARIDSDYGQVGIKAEGSGELRSGFAGILAASAPRLVDDGCKARGASLYGKLAVVSQSPRFAGPLRLESLACAKHKLALGKSGAQVSLTADPGLDGGEATVALDLHELAQGANKLGVLGGTSRLTFRKGMLVGEYELAAKGIAAPQAKLASLALEGRLRAADELKRIDLEGTLKGERLALGDTLDAALGSVVRAGEGTLVQPLARQIRTALARQGRNSSLAANYVVRMKPEGASLVVPGASLRGGSGEALLSLSRFQLASAGDGSPLISGNFATGGSGLPRIAGRMERRAGSGLAMQIRMPEYRAGKASLALERLVVHQKPGGALGFAGEALVTGGIPGGTVEALSLPLAGSWSSRKGISLWSQCVELRFARLELAGLALSRNSLPVCPVRGSAIVSNQGGTMRVIAGLPGLSFSGRLGSSPVKIATGPAAIALPGKLSVRDVAIALGPDGNVSHFRIGRLDGRLGGSPGGRFEKAQIELAAVPLDVFDAGGAWAYRNGALAIEQGEFRLEDREQVDRFQPLVARDASFAFADGVISAAARLREPQSLREIVRAELRHELANATGSADLFADGVRFDSQVQPATLSYLALGVIANAQGEVRGQGRIDWNPQEVTSTGRFATDAFDFAAAFGPVEGVSGTVEFTDLLGLVTAPDQRLQIRAINPGIEVNDGVLTFQMDEDDILRITGAKWPFLGGTLTLEPATMRIGANDELHYELVMEGLDAGRFLERIEMENLSASGSFTGRIPLVFDEDGGRIEGGRLVSQPPGGNLSYVGDLSYEDLGTFGNFAFGALRSLDFKQMQIDLDGSLEGEIFTRVTIDGVGQGKLARRNFLTRQVAKLPIRFNVNVRAPFIRLVTSLRSLYDPEYLRNPETLGIVDLPVPPGRVVDVKTPADNSIQPPVSEKMP